MHPALKLAACLREFTCAFVCICKSRISTHSTPQPPLVISLDCPFPFGYRSSCVFFLGCCFFCDDAFVLHISFTASQSSRQWFFWNYRFCLFLFCGVSVVRGGGEDGWFGKMPIMLTLFVVWFSLSGVVWRPPYSKQRTRRVERMNTWECGTNRIILTDVAVVCWTCWDGVWFWTYIGGTFEYILNGTCTR